MNSLEALATATLLNAKAESIYFLAGDAERNQDYIRTRLVELQKLLDQMKAGFGLRG